MFSCDDSWLCNVKTLIILIKNEYFFWHVLPVYFLAYRIWRRKKIRGKAVFQS